MLDIEAFVNLLLICIVAECLRGKIDIVLVVDQSGSVNHCNFQKIKRWLRNIVRGINFGENEQDVGVIVYSSAGKIFVSAGHVYFLNHK